MFKVFFIALISLQSYAFAAICDCDAPPECGSSRPSSCRKKVSRPLNGKTFIAEDILNSHQISLVRSESTGFLSVAYDDSSEANTQNYVAVMSSEASFNLFKTVKGEASVLVDQFSFEKNNNDEIEVLENSNGSLFLLK